MDQEGQDPVPLQDDAPAGLTNRGNGKFCELPECRKGLIERQRRFCCDSHRYIAYDRLRPRPPVPKNQLSLPMAAAREPRPGFGGETYAESHDVERLGKQLDEVLGLMIDGNWRTPSEMESKLGFNWASISARLRDLRKNQFGHFRVERQAVEPRRRGLYRYRVLHQEG